MFVASFITLIQFVKMSEDRQQEEKSSQQMEQEKPIDDINNIPNNIESKKKQFEGEVDSIDSSQQAKYYYSILFSPVEKTNSLKMKTQVGDEQDDQMGITSRRKKRVNYLQAKQEQQIQIMNKIFTTDTIRFQAILQLFKFLSELKQKVKVEYYSNKTFCAMRSASSEQLSCLHKVLKTIYDNLINGIDDEQGQNCQFQHTDQNLVRQFLLIPRFLISREKIQQFIKDEEVQNSFQFLIQNICLGHQNNQANKKMPDKDLIKLLTALLTKPNGKEMFKIICSINHANKYKLQHGKTTYAALYNKTIEELRSMDRKIKKHNRKQLQASSKSNLQSDEEFMPEPRKFKCKLKSTASLNVEPTQLMKRRLKKGVKSLNENVVDGFNENKQLLEKEEEIILKQFEKINQKIIENIILVFPKNEK